MFDLLKVQMEKGLTCKTICMSYAGNPDVIRSMSGYKALEQAAERHGVKLLMTVMSTTAGINVGPGSFAVGFISDKMGRDD